MHEALQQCITARSVDVSAVRCRRHVQKFLFGTDAIDLHSTKRFSAHHIHSHFHLEDGHRDHGMMFPRVRITPLIDLASDTGNTRVSESDARLLVLFSYSNRPLL